MKLKKLLTAAEISPNEAALFSEHDLLSKKLTKKLRKNPRVSETDEDAIHRIFLLKRYGFTDQQIVQLTKDSAAADAAVNEYIEHKQKIYPKDETLLEVLSEADHYDFKSVSDIILETDDKKTGLGKITKNELTEKTIFTVFGAIFVAIASLYILFVIGCHVVIGSNIIHPTIRWSHVLGILILLIPAYTVLLLGVYVIRKYRRFKPWYLSSNNGARRVKATVSLVVALLIALMPRFDLAFQMFCIPVYTKTCDTDDYLELDDWTEEVLTNRADGLLHQFIPEDATDAKYYYYSDTYGLNSDSVFEIFIEWKLSDEKFSREVTRVTLLTTKKGEFTLGDFKCIAFGSAISRLKYIDYYPYFFAYNEDTNTVRYVYYSNILDKGFENAYFYSLEW